MNKKSIFKTKFNVQTMRKFAAVSLVALFVAGWFGSAMATPEQDRNSVKRIYDRLIGVPPTENDLTQMITLLGTDPSGLSAAQYAINSGDRNKEFYNTTLKNFFVRYTNLENSPLEPLNDAAATMIGMVKNDIPFDQVLYGDILFVGGAAVTPYSRTNNTHYEELENSRFDLSTLTQRTQSAAGGPVAAASGSGAPKYAGVLTTRAWGEAYYSDGTNRRVLEFTVNKFMCRKLEELKDNTRVPDRIRQDVSRSPGGDSSIFLNFCIACHSGMDPLAAAFAYYEWQETAVDSGAFGLVYNDNIKHDPNAAPPVKHKYLINAGSFPQGYITIDDGWENYWREGKNAELGWGEVNLSSGAAVPNVSDPSGKTNSGNGAASYGQEFASSNAFAECQVTKVYRQVCLQEPTTEHQLNQANGASGLNSIVAGFKTNFNMKNVFAETAALCMGQ